MDYKPVMLSDVNKAIEDVLKLTEVVKTWSIPATKQMVKQLVSLTLPNGEKPYADFLDLCAVIDYSDQRLIRVMHGDEKPSKALVSKLFSLYSCHFPDAKIVCAECDGTGQIHSKAELPWGSSVMIPCPACASKISLSAISY